LEWSRRTPLMDNGLTATLCGTGDVGCTRPLSPRPIPIRTGSLGATVQLPPGAAGIPVVEGFDGFIKFDVTPDVPIPDDQQFVSTLFYLNGVIAGPISQGPAILMFQKQFRQNILQASFPSVDFNTVVNQGVVVVGVYDCNSKPVEDARVELTSG